MSGSSLWLSAVVKEVDASLMSFFATVLIYLLPYVLKRNPQNVPSSILPNTYYPAVSGFVAEQNGRWKVFLSHDVVEKNKNRKYLDPILSTGIRKSKNADVGT